MTCSGGFSVFSTVLLCFSGKVDNTTITLIGFPEKHKKTTGLSHLLPYLLHNTVTLENKQERRKDLQIQMQQHTRIVKSKIVKSLTPCNTDFHPNLIIWDFVEFSTLIVYSQTLAAILIVIIAS